MPRSLLDEATLGLMPIERAVCPRDGEVMADATAIYKDGQPVDVRVVCPFCEKQVNMRKFRAGQDTVIR